MLFEVVDLQLLVVTQIAHGKGGGLPQMPSHRKLLTERRGRDERGGHDVMVVVAQGENLVVRLSVVGTEHQTAERQVQLIAESLIRCL